MSGGGSKRKLARRNRPRWKPIAPTLRNEQHNIAPGSHPEIYFELLKPCPIPLQIYWAVETIPSTLWNCMWAYGVESFWSRRLKFNLNAIRPQTYYSRSKHYRWSAGLCQMTYFAPLISKRPWNQEMERICSVMHQRLWSSITLHLSTGRGRTIKTVLQIVTVMCAASWIRGRHSRWDSAAKPDEE